MFQVVMSNPKLMVESIKAAYELVKDEVTFKLGEEGITLRAMDPANVAMVIIELKKDAFDKYELEKDGFVGINMDRFVQVLKRAKRGDSMNLKIGAGKMEIIYEGSGRRRFSLPLLALESGPRPEPNLNFSATAKVEQATLKGAIEDAAVVSDAMTILAANDELHLLAQGDLGDVETILKKGEGLIEMSMQENARSKFSTEYLRKIAKSKVGDSLEISLKSDYPLLVKFEEPNLRLAFILAPRMDVE